MKRIKELIEANRRCRDMRKNSRIKWANVKVCDRCGKRVDPCSGMYSVIRGVKFNFFKIYSDTEYGYKNHDLCHDCMKDYEAFIDGGEVVSKEEE